MNKRAVIYGFIYSICVIIYKLVIILTGQQLTTFGFYYSHIISVFMIIPFMIISVKYARDIENGGVISGKDALKVGLTIFGISVVILSCYNAIEFVWKLEDISKEYYNGEAYHAFLERQAQLNPGKLKPEMFQTIIDENIAALSPMKAVTAKLFSFFLICFSSAFIVAVFMKKRSA
jgi:hypothetical protein